MIKLIRDKEIYPQGPWTAEVPESEVQNYAKGGWYPAGTTSKDEEDENTPRRGRPRKLEV